MPARGAAGDAAAVKAPPLVAPVVYDPFSDAFKDDPFPVYQRLRDEAPVYRSEKWGFYALSRYEDCRQALLDPTTTILATARAGGGIGVVSARATAAPIAAGELVELTVRELALTRPLHAVWLGHAPSAPADELIKLAG